MQTSGIQTANIFLACNPPCANMLLFDNSTDTIREVGLVSFSDLKFLSRLKIFPVTDPCCLLFNIDVVILTK